MREGEQDLPASTRLLVNPSLGVFLGIAALAAFTAFTPGLLNADSIDMLDQSMKGRYHDWHSPLMAAIWSITNKLKPGPAVMLLLQLVTFFIGMYFILGRLFATRLATMGAAMLIIVLPPVFATLGYVNKDSFALATFAVMIGLFVADVCHGNSRLLLGWVAAGALTCAIRLDYLPFVSSFCGVRLWVSLLRPRWTSSAGWNVLTFIGAVTASLFGALAAALGVALAINFLNYGVLKSERRHSLQATLLHDIAGISAAQNENLYPRWIQDRGVTSAVIAARYSPAGGDHLFWGGDPKIARVPFTFDAVQLRDLRVAWLHSVLSNPKAYLRHRLAVFRCMINTCSDPYWNFQYATDPSDGYSIDYERTGLTQPIALAEIRKSYLGNASRTVFSRPSAYIVVMVLCLAFIVVAPRLARPGRLGSFHRGVLTTSMALTLGAASHLILLGLVTPAGLFRYLTPTFFVAIVVAVLAVRMARDTCAPSVIGPIAVP